MKIQKIDFLKDLISFINEKDNKDHPNNATIDSIISELSNLERDTYNHWSKNTFDSTINSDATIDIESGTTNTRNSIETAIHNIHLLHSKLSERRQLERKKTVAYQVLTIYVAKGRKNQRERLLREVISDLKIDFDIIGDTPKELKELCYTITKYIQKRNEFLFCMYLVIV